MEHGYDLSRISNWLNLMSSEITQKITELLNRAQSLRKQGITIYPAQENIFRALELVPPNEVKVLVLGQDPYHEEGQANGLAFSVNDGVKFPPSLRNIFKELHADTGKDIPSSGDLTGWARQGVLLLNTVLTVEDGKANSHKDWGWQEVTLEIVRIALAHSKSVVCVMWGKQALDFVGPLQTVMSGHNVICSTHPSPLSANRAAGKSVPAFIGSKPFSKVNECLTKAKVTPITW